jgi:hypothetical protein
MGAYYGLYNQTRKHGVSHYWKGSPPSVGTIRSIATRYGWDLASDKIFSGSYRDLYELKQAGLSLTWADPEDVHLSLDMEVQTGWEPIFVEPAEPAAAIEADRKKFSSTFFFN